MTVDVKSVLKSTQKSSSNLRPDKRKEWLGEVFYGNLGLVLSMRKSSSKLRPNKRKEWMGEVFYGNLGLVLSMWCILETFLDWRAAFRDVMVG